MKISQGPYLNTKVEEREGIQGLKARLIDLSIRSSILRIAIIDIHREFDVWFIESNINSSTILNLPYLIYYLTNLKG